MTDLLLAWNNDIAGADLCVEGADLALDHGLTSAVVISLFTHRRVSAEELPEGEADRRGWWGDALSDGGDEIGSKLWLLEREKETPQVLARAEGYAREALAWIARDQLVESVTVAATWPHPGEMALDVVAQLPDGRTREFQFSDVLRAA